MFTLSITNKLILIGTNLMPKSILFYQIIPKGLNLNNTGCNPVNEGMHFKKTTRNGLNRHDLISAILF